MSTDRMRLRHNGPVVFVRWCLECQRYEERATRRDEWVAVPTSLVTLDAWATLTEIRAATEAEAAA